MHQCHGRNCDLLKQSREETPKSSGLSSKVGQEGLKLWENYQLFIISFCRLFLCNFFKVYCPADFRCDKYIINITNLI